jgi:heme exporter protein C
MFTYANPNRFMQLARRLTLPVWGLCLACLSIGLYMAFSAPADYQQGMTVRIMFIHVPAAWMSLFVYTFLTISSIFGLVFRHPLGHVAAKSAALIGAGFTLITLITGALWGKPMWGTCEDPLQAGRVSSVLAIVGFVNVPIVKFSVDWWNTLHQPASVSRFDAPALHSDYLWPLLVMALGFQLLFFALWLLRMQTEIFKQKLRVRRLGLVETSNGTVS